ncbi:MAG: gamma-glutamyltransferase [Bryobacteraceae bacterium]
MPGLGLRLLVMICALAPLSARHPERARLAMVVAQEPHATDAGVAALRAGGNAVDAAIAVAFALAVTHPQAGNLGGGGFMLVRLADGRAAFIDFRERAPEAAARDMYLDAEGKLTRDSIVGWRAAGVPGTVSGLEMAHRKFGTRPWAGLVAPSIKLAGEGFELSYAGARSLRNSKVLAQFPESKRIFQRNGEYYVAGERLRQPDLARTLERIARLGAAGFYQGETAKILAEAMAANGGLITGKDLAQYAAVERKPLAGRYRGLEILTAPPPSSGGAGLLQMLGVLEGSGYEKPGHGAAATIHFVAEAMRRYYADRSEHLADPDFHRVPVTGLTGRAHVARLRKSIDREKATPSSAVRAAAAADLESSETTHLSIIDDKGNAVALTYTINGGFGCGVIVPGLGFLLNNEMDDFSARPGTPNLFGLVHGEANRIEPRKRPLSAMTPTIVLREGKPYLVLGAPGGSRIITGVLQVFLNVVDFGMNIQEAVDAPRFHHQWMPDRLTLERGFSPDTVALLEAKGHTVDGIPDVARVEAILNDGAWLQGATDRRGRGKAAGY